MDIVTDLTSRAVAYITVLQDLSKLVYLQNSELQTENLWAIKPYIKNLKDGLNNQQKEAITDIIWSSYGEQSVTSKLDLFLDFSADLIDWMQANIEPGKYETPYEWRNAIRRVLYTKPEQRITLVDKIHYMPIQLIMCVAGKKELSSLSAYDQRLYQVWQPDGNFSDVLSLVDEDKNYSWWHTVIDHSTRHDKARILIESDKKIFDALTAVEAPLPFETIFYQELSEICESRKTRYADLTEEMRKTLECNATSNDADPLARAAEMKLYGLAFSGGGIRAATFNLGVLQKLAELDRLPRFDYISTVSGGGYIGTWFTSWIKRGGSVLKIADRLNPDKSKDPMAEEVRPIRWLRMFSNYLAPDASIMSIDAWTMGITWLRNTIINQTILFLLLLTMLSFISVVFRCWGFLALINNTYSTFSITLWSAIILLPGAIITGMGMHSYHRQYPPQNILNFGRNKFLPGFLLIWAIGAGFFLSSWFSINNSSNIAHFFTNWPDIKDKLTVLEPACIISVLAMLLVAYIGYYRDCAPNKKKYADLAIIASSIVAAVAGLCLLVFVWEFLSHLHSLSDVRFGHKYIFKYKNKVFSFHLKADNTVIQSYGRKLVFITGVPILLEIFSCCVVIRMALMGRLFPDERREWWGRMGAITHRFSFIWLLITVSALLLPYELKRLFASFNVPALFGGWAAIIGAGVKLAYQSNENKDKNSGALGNAINIFVLIAPYLFMIGFVLLGAYTLEYFINSYPKVNFGKIHAPLDIVITILIGSITLILGWRVGVNEFSLHHFYKNRLVRAYMGATRSRASREKTVNPFTQFDSKDDLPLNEFTTEDKYYGPLPILNAALNSTKDPELDRQDRKAESFVFTPLYCGFDFSLTRSAATANQLYEYGYRPTAKYAYPDSGGPKIGTTMAISGAAINPNWGYHSSPAAAFLLTIFNVRLGWWMGNPRKSTWKRSDPKLGLAYLINDLVGNSSIDSDYVCLSDGGHFDNMGLYELIRRKCSYIVLGDAEEDDDSSFEGLANAIRRCRIDYGVEIDIRIDDMIPASTENNIVKATVAQGKISYPGIKEPGTLIYIKSRITKKVTTDIRQYNSTHKSFPEQSTADQFFTEDQFESYRKLGYDAINEGDLAIKK